MVSSETLQEFMVLQVSLGKCLHFLLIVNPTDYLILIFPVNGSAITCYALMLRLFCCATDATYAIPDRHSLHRVGYLSEVVLLDLIWIKVINCRL